MTGADPCNDNGNGKVTLALIGQQQAEILRRVCRIEDKQDAMVDTVNELKRTDAARSEQVKAVREDVDELKKTRNTWDLVNSIGVILAGVLGMTGGSK